MPDLVEAAVGLLNQMRSAEGDLFSYSARLTDGKVVNDFDSGSRFRYTINVLAGLQRVPDAAPGGLQVEDGLDLFLDRHLDAVSNVGDRGLLLFVLANAARDHETLLRSLLSVAASPAALRRANLQELCWLLLGLSRWGDHARDGETEVAARAVFTLIEREYLNRDTLLPYHSPRGARRRFVSFGGIAYFLMALFEYARTTGDAYAETLAYEASQVVLALQGPSGEWAWFYDADRTRIIDWYELFTVHQAAMAPLFLLPAVDAGVPGAAEAVRRGYRWIFGDNDLGAAMMQLDPFFTFRSIRRRGPLTRPRRYLRGAAGWVPGVAGRRTAPAMLEVNRECRSYELGWLVYSWAGRTDFEEFRTLALAGG